MWGDRSGREPTSARSPLRLRRWLSIAGAALSIVAILIFPFTGWDTWWAVIALIVLAAIGIVDAAVITRHMKNGTTGSSDSGV
jgi:uncharacterized membrane protein